jgi:NADH-quinone oxidoreductase subunit A
MNLLDYLPVIIFIGIAFGFSCLLILISWLRSKKKPYREKLTPYECGFDTFDDPLENTRHRFSVQFYLVAILFIILILKLRFFSMGTGC